MQGFMVVIVTRKTGEDPFKNEGASVAITFFPIISLGENVPQGQVTQ